MSAWMASSRWAAQSAPALPSGLILFDGVCVFCSGWVRFVIRRDRARIFRFVALQSRMGRELARQFAINPNEPDTNAVVLDGFAYFKSDAALAVLSRLPGWGWTRIFAALPRAPRDFLYDRIARNRYAFFGRRDSCMVPTPDLRDRFIPDGLP